MNSHHNPTMNNLVVVILLIFASASCGMKSKVLMISMDGFRYDYLKKANTPNFDSLIREGVTMPHMNAAFVTKTFPNHYTIVTGLYTESHGIIANYMYDPQYDEIFTMKSTESKWWNEGEPIWTTAIKAGLRAGVYYWPGSEAEVQGIRPTEWRQFNESIPYDERVNTTVSWLKSGFDLALMYFNEPDSSGHEFGPDAPEMVPVIEKMDSLLGLILHQLKVEGLQDEVNLIVTSDHGMTTVDLDNKVIDVTDYINGSAIVEGMWGVVAMIIPMPGKAKYIRDGLANVPHLQVWLKEDIPEHYHLKNNRRVPEIIAVAEEGWSITNNRSDVPYQKKGDHGYDPSLSNMKTIFFAKGPAFKSGKNVEPMTNRDIYPLLCHLLNITEAPNNGSFDIASHLLKTHPNDINEAILLKLDRLFVLVLGILVVFWRQL